MFVIFSTQLLNVMFRHESSICVGFLYRFIWLHTSIYICYMHIVCFNFLWRYIRLKQPVIYVVWLYFHFLCCSLSLRAVFVFLFFLMYACSYRSFHLNMSYAHARVLFYIVLSVNIHHFRYVIHFICWEVIEFIACFDWVHASYP